MFAGSLANGPVNLNFGVSDSDMCHYLPDVISKSLFLSSRLPLECWLVPVI
jgi:hypothetical protein